MGDDCIKKNNLNKYLLFLLLLAVNLFAFDFNTAQRIEKEEGVLKALNTYKILANRDDIKSIFRLAQIYSRGEGVQKDPRETIKYLEKGKKLNDNKSIYFLGKLYLRKTPYYDKIEAYNNFVIAANTNYAPAQNIIGELFATGTIVQKDYKLAVKYFEKASKQGLMDANCNLSFMYASGKGVFVNFGRAHQFAKKGLAKNKKCKKVWNEYKLDKYTEDKGWKFNFYTKPK